VTPLERLFEQPGLASFGLSEDLAAAYGGDFGLKRPGLYANFVASADGVVALPGDKESGGIVSGEDAPDRFIVGLLRAAADAVLIGAGTFRKANGARWCPESASPTAEGLFARMRQKLSLLPHPLLVVVTASGQIDAAQPALENALVVTTPQGEIRLRGRLPSGARIAVFDAQRIGGHALLDLIHAQGLHVVLAEGGPTLLGQLLEEGLIDELFLTVSPRLFGRWPGDGRKSLVEGVDQKGRLLELLSASRHESHLYLRYALRADGHSKLVPAAESRRLGHQPLSQTKD
jgi:riboflavin biosynthesis pyrimidine reductase